MKITLLIWLTLFSKIVYGQMESNIAIVHKQQKYYLTKTCYDIIKWDEVIIKNQKVCDKINSIIRNNVNSYKLPKSYASLVCYKTNDFSQMATFKVVYTKHNLLSYFLHSDIYYKGILHDLHQFNTLNFNLKTGEQVSFNDLFDSTKLSNVDSLIMRKITSERRFDGADSIDLKHNLEDKKFNIKDDGIEILYWYGSYPIDLFLTFNELKPFVNRKALLKTFYAKQSK